MIFPGIPQLCGGVYISFFFAKCPFRNTLVLTDLKSSNLKSHLQLSAEQEAGIWQIIAFHGNSVWDKSCLQSDFYKLLTFMDNQIFHLYRKQIVRINQSTGNQNVLHIISKWIPIVLLVLILCTLLFSFALLAGASLGGVSGSLFVIVSPTLGWGHLGNWCEAHPGFPAEQPPGNDRAVSQDPVALVAN